MLPDLTSRQFGCWTVIGPTTRPAASKEQGRFFMCRCQCGHEQAMAAGRINAGRGGRACRACFGHGHARSRSLSPTYNSWRGMRERCSDPRHSSYRRYGGRGITVCDRWRHSFEHFLTDMGERPVGMSLDRINPDLGYSLENCRWATVKQQTTNTVRGAVTDEQKAAIVEIYQSGVSARLIADAVGVARGTVSAIVSREVGAVKRPGHAGARHG